MKKILNRISLFLRCVFGYGIAFSLFLGAAGFFGYIAALIAGGNVAAEICDFIYKIFYPIVIRMSVITVLIGLLAMYIGGETALTFNGKRKTK